MSSVLIIHHSDTQIQVCTRVHAHTAMIMTLLQTTLGLIQVTSAPVDATFTVWYLTLVFPTDDYQEMSFFQHAHYWSRFSKGTDYKCRMLHSN